MALDVRIPSLGESVTEGVIVRWAKRDGETVARDEVLLELETDKASMEIPAEGSGVLRIVKQEGETVAVGEVVARIEDGASHAGVAAAAPPAGPARTPAPVTSLAAARGGASPAAPRPDGVPADRAAPRDVATPNLEAASEQDAITVSRGVGPLSPAVRALVDEHDLDPASIPATGKGGRLTKADVLAHLEGRDGKEAPLAASGREATPEAASGETAGAPRVPEPPPPASAGATQPEAARGAATGTARRAEGEERVPMSRIRRRIAERLVEAQHTAAILTTFNELDMTAVMALRAQHKEAFQKTHGVPLGFMSFFARACIAALREIPVVNAEVRGDDIVYKHFVHLGIAVGTERGLVVPIVHDADRMSFADIEREIARLAGLARANKLSIDDLSGGTFTISNGGVYGSLMSTPILNPPQSGILGMHKIEKRPVVVNDQIVIRPMMYLALSYDHRVVDGEQAVTFLVRVKERLEDPARLLLEV